MFKGFKAFISRGNVIDLAVAVVMGVAFTAIVDSLSKEIISPIIGKFGGQPDFAGFRPFDIGIGAFINAVIAFLIKAAGLYFFIVLPFNRFAKHLAAPPTPSEALLAEIRDTLRSRLNPPVETKPTVTGRL